MTGEGGLRAAVQQVTHVGPENPDRPGLDPRSYTVHTLASHFTEDPCVVCAALAAPAPDTLRAALDKVLGLWFDRALVDDDPDFRQAMIDLREAATRPEEG